MSEPSATQRLALYGTLLSLGFGVFAFGATELWARNWLLFAALGCLTLVLWNGLQRGLFPRPAVSLAIPGMVLILFAVVQVIPLPRPVLRLISPNAAELYGRSAPRAANQSVVDWLLDRAEEDGIRVDDSFPVPDLPEPEAGGESAGRSLSVYPYGTVRAARNWLTAIVFFLVAASLARYRQLRYRLLWGIVLLSGLLGAVGILQRVTWNGQLLWIRPRPPGSMPLGPFVNPTNFAGVVEMGALVALGLVLAHFARHGSRLNLETIRLAVLDRQWTLPRLLLVGALALLSITGLVISGSRGGYLAFGAGMIFLVLARRFRAVLIVAVGTVAVLGAALGLVTWIGETPGEEAGTPFVLTGTDPSGSVRLNTWGTTLRICADFPVAGTGLGSFRWIYPAYQRSGEWTTWNQAHNDYVQLLSETGILGAAVLVWALVVFARRFLWVALRDEGERSPWTTAALAAAVFAMLVHTVLDFNLQIPSNAALFAVLLGALAASVSGEDRNREQGDTT